jgi:SET domain-containing protein
VKLVIKIRAIKNIKPGDEITYHYGRNYFDAFIRPVGCKCLACAKKRAKERAEKRAKKSVKKSTKKRGKTRARKSRRHRRVAQAR